MMFDRQKAANAFSIFKWKQLGESSLYKGLLHNVPPEVELSNYAGIPSPGSESPSGLLNGESLNAEPIADLDLFFERLYSYYCDKGLWCIILRWVVELLSLGFIICFSGFFLLFVDWNGLQNAKCGMDAVESGIKPCDLVKEALHAHPLTPFTLSKAIIVGYLVLFSLYWIFCFVRLFAQLKDTLRIRDFYYNRLHVTDNEIQTMLWATVLERVVRLQSSQQLCVVKDLSAHDIVMRLMRKENYLIGMLNKGVLAFPISHWVPGAGPMVRSRPNGTENRLILTKMLEWTLNWCILQSMFDRNFHVRRDFISNPRTLKKQLVVVGLAMLLLSPFLVIFMLVYLFLRHAEQFYNHPSTASSRRWSNLSKWMFREFNEVEHLFKHRINSSVVHASEYLKQFPSPIISIIAKFISFVSGGFAAVLIIIAFLEESLLEGHIFGRNLFWYAAVFGTITAVSRAAITDEILVLDPVGTMSAVVRHTHYMPKRWRGKESTEAVRMEFETLFQYTGMMLLEEMASIFLTPFLLMFVVPKRVDNILQFIAEFTIEIEGVGHVCSFSAFDFQHHGNTKYGSPYNAPGQRSSQGKMEKSFLSFQSSYPSWEPNVQGREFLSKLRRFEEQKLQALNMRLTRSLTRLWHETPVLHGHNIDGYRPASDPSVDSLWLIDPEQRNQPYILDWYYSSGLHDPSDNPAERCPGENNVSDQKARDFWDLKQMETRINVGYVENRYENDIESSVMDGADSRTFFHRSVLQNDLPDIADDVNAPGSSHWWNRSSRPSGVQPETSFIEPPDFVHPYSSGNFFHGNSSELSNVGEDHEQYMEWGSSSGPRRMISRTMFMEEDEIETGDDNDDDGVNPIFGDVYNGWPPESPNLNLNPVDFGA